jgi:hypothetical protein
VVLQRLQSSSGLIMLTEFSVEVAEKQQSLFAQQRET